MELILIEGVLVVVPFTNELTAETELMTFTWLSPEKVYRTRRALDPRRRRGTLSCCRTNRRQIKKING